MSSTATSSPTHNGAPVFPLEIELEIFTATAMLHEETMPTLLRVAHRVLIWTYTRDRSITLCNPKEHVRNVMWWADWQEENLRTLFSICTGIKNLALRTLNPQLVDCISSLRLQRMTSPLWSHLLPTLASCSSLTHLHVLDYGEAVFPWIKTLPSLTHLCLANTLYTDRLLIETLLKKGQQLRVCVLFLNPYGQRASGPWIDDDRVVIMPLEASDHYYVQDWKLGAAGGKDFWVRAEEFLELKRRDKSIS
ncbi:hypothetical protein DFH06DRAFT_1421871 [Mycena polygramma]|nr:hypothetical protein DFH06DRAFT_1421871 [Mycena polygramma]